MSKCIWFTLVLMLGYCVDIQTVNVMVHNELPFPVFVRWNFIGDYFRRNIDAYGVVGVSSFFLHKGFQDVHITKARVGDVWGKDPETGDDLYITKSMLTKERRLSPQEISMVRERPARETGPAISEGLAKETESIVFEGPAEETKFTHESKTRGEAVGTGVQEHAKQSTGDDYFGTRDTDVYEGEVWGLQPADVYRAPLGQAVYNHFLLEAVPERNPQDNNNWWPRFKITRSDKNIFVQVKDKLVDTFKVFDKYGSEGIALLNALRTGKPVNGFELSEQNLKSLGGYVPQAPLSKQPVPLSLAQEKKKLEELMTEVDASGRPSFEKELLKRTYQEELNIVKAIDKYRPVFYLHPQDMAGPVDPRDFFAGETTAVRLGNNRNGLGRFALQPGEVTFKKLARLTNINPRGTYTLWHATPSQPLTYDRRILYGSDFSHYTDNAIPIHVVTYYGKVQARDKKGNPVIDKKGKPVYEKDRDGYYVPDKRFFYIQYLCLYGYNQPYDITIPRGTLFKGDVYDFQNAHEGDLEHLTMKVDAKTGALVAIYYGSHGGDEGMWMYPPGSKGNPDEEFDVDSSGRPIVFSAFGGHGNYPKAGVYTRVYGFANDFTARGALWVLTENNIYRTVRKESAGFNPILHAATNDNFEYLDWIGNLGPRGIISFKGKSWAGSIEGEDKGRDAREVHTKHFCSGESSKAINPSITPCIRAKSKASPPPGNERPWYIKMLQEFGII